MCSLYKVAGDKLEDRVVVITTFGSFNCWESSVLVGHVSPGCHVGALSFYVAVGVVYEASLYDSVFMSIAIGSNSDRVGSALVDISIWDQMSNPPSTKHNGSSPIEIYTYEYSLRMFLRQPLGTVGWVLSSEILTCCSRTLVQRPGLSLKFSI